MEIIQKYVHENSSVLDSELCRCQSCATPLEYTPGSPEVICKSCGASKSFIEELTQAEYTPYSHGQLRNFTDLEVELTTRPFENLTTHCPSCGAEISIKEDVASRCQYCRSPFHVPFKKIYAGVEPSGMIPFEISEKEALRKFRFWYNYNLSRWIFGMKIKFDNAERMTPIYVPAYLFKTNAHIEYEGKYHESSDAGIQSGEFDTALHHFPVPTESYESNRLHWYSCSLLSWDIQSLKVFRPELISGTSITPFYLSHKTVVNIAAEAHHKRFDTLAKEDMGGKIPVLYKLDVKVTKAESIAALLPVWRLKASYKDKPVWCLMNGVNGKFIARGPSPSKTQVYIAGIILFALFFGIAEYQLYIHSKLQVGRSIFFAVFTLFSVAALLAGLQKKIGVALSIGVAIGCTLFLMIISLSDFTSLIWYYVALFILYGMTYLSYKLSSSDEFDESEFEQDDLNTSNAE